MKNKLSVLLSALVVAMLSLTSCNSDEPFGVQSSVGRVDLSGADMLVMLNYENELNGLSIFKINSNGNTSDVKVFIREGGRDSKDFVTVKPQAIQDITEDFILFQYCQYLDPDGAVNTALSQKYRHVFVRKNDGRMFSSDLPFTMPINNPFRTNETVFLQDGLNTMYVMHCMSNGSKKGVIGKLTLENDGFKWHQLSSDSWPILYYGYPRLFKMKNGTIAAVSGRNAASAPILELMGLIYPDGTYDWFERVTESGTRYSNSYIPLSDGYLKVTPYTGHSEIKYVRTGKTAGDTQLISCLDVKYGLGIIESWYEMNDRILIKSVPGSLLDYYIVYDKMKNTVTYPDIDFTHFGDPINLLDKEMYDQKFWGFIDNRGYEDGGSRTKLAWVDPNSLSWGMIDYDEFDKVNGRYQSALKVKDFKRNRMLIYGPSTRDNRNVIVSVDIKSGETEVVYADEHIKIKTIVPLN